MTEGWEDNKFINLAFDPFERSLTGNTFDNEDHLFSNCLDHRLARGYLIFSGGKIKK